jgi:hypothetical protein
MIEVIVKVGTTETIWEFPEGTTVEQINAQLEFIGGRPNDR